MKSSERNFARRIDLTSLQLFLAYAAQLADGHKELKRGQVYAAGKVAF